MSASKRRWLVPTAVLVAIVAIAPAYVRAYRVFGASDAPTFPMGDRILVNKAAYDLRLPYTQIVLLAHSTPARGDVVMFHAPGEEYLVFKRVIGCPGDRLAMRDDHLRVNGISMNYKPVDRGQFQSIAESNQLGTIVEEESGNGPAHWVSYTPGAGPVASFDAVLVPEGHYFVLGDNRGNSEDSRTYGPISRRSIVGKVLQ